MLLKRKYLFGSTILAGVMAVTAPALAQTTQLPGVTAQGQQEEATNLGEIVSTGSRLRRDPANAPTPLITVSREDLLSTGQTTVIDYLATIPALSNSVVPSDTTGSNLGDGGLSLANLRTLGSGRTLTLVNGRRQVGSNGGSLAVDIDTIPRLLIQNIEIITGGASSVYGADAVSGVLNFVLRKDFEGVEIDANYGQINQGGQANSRLSVLAGVNLMDDRLNLWGFAEYDQNDEIQILDIDWYKADWGLVGADADPANPNVGPASDGIFDVTGPVGNRRQLQILRWGQTTLANNQAASPLNDPDIPFANCSSVTASACYSIAPGKTWVFEGLTARLADFGQRLGATGHNRTTNIGGDGAPTANFGQVSRTPESKSFRYAAGVNFDLTSNVRFSADAKYVTEETFDVGQPTFFDFYIANSFGRNDVDNALAGNAFLIHLNTTAYLPSNLRSAIQGNQMQQYGAPTNTAAGQPGAIVNAPFARHTLFGPDRTQFNTRELFQFNASLEGGLDRLWFVNNFNWSLSYGQGVVDIENVETGLDNQRVQLSSDAIEDSAGLVNGRPGEIVCRAQLLRAENPANFLGDSFRGGDLRDSAEGLKALNECTPLNVFGEGNQSPEALAYIFASINPTERNEQEQAIAFVSGELWDFFGAGPIGLAAGVEYRREYTEAVGRDAATGDRFLFLNGGADFPGAEYESEEAFAELSIPLFRDSWLGKYAEISGSYRYFDYTTVGTGDVYGINFVYRPIQDIAFKTSFNTSFRAPNLGENFSPYTDTFWNGVTDPCDTRVIININNANDKANRVANCKTLFAQVAARRGLPAPSFDFDQSTPGDPNDDYNPTYPSGINGVQGGNPALKPETSESFTFSTVIEPRFFPNFSLVLDYYEIEIKDVIQSVAASAAALNCVSGDSLNQSACDTIFRDNSPQGGNTAEDRSQAYEIGTPGNQGIAFIEGSINFAKLTTRGLDFTARYSLDTEEAFGRNFGRFAYSIRGNWLIEQKNFTNISDPNIFSDLTGVVNLPRVRFTSQLTWSPNDTWSVSWVADWQSAQDTNQTRDMVNNLDSRPTEYYNTGDFTRHDFTVRYNVNDQLTLRGGVTNAFDAEQPRYFGTGFIDNMDPYGTRFFFGLNYRPW